MNGAHDNLRKVDAFRFLVIWATYDPSTSFHPSTLGELVTILI